MNTPQRSEITAALERAFAQDPRGVRRLLFNLGWMGTAQLALLLGLGIALVVLAPVFWLQWLLLGILLTGLLLPLLFRGMLVRHATQTFGVLRFVRWLLLIRVILHLIGTWPATGFEAIVMLGVLALHSGTTFWLLSDRRITTERGQHVLRLHLASAIQMKAQETAAD